MVEAKHEFIDDNPYLVYSSDAEATANGSGGGGGFPVVGQDDESNITVKAGELVSMLKESPVLTYSENPLAHGLTWFVITSYVETQVTGYIFYSYSYNANGGTIPWMWSANTLDDYPAPYEG